MTQPTQNAQINLKNINWLRNLKSVPASGKFDGHLIAEIFDQVNLAYGQLEARIKALETPPK